MASPEISIIVPIYNSANTIRECVASIVAQTFMNWELLLVDNGSTDRSLDIIEDLADREQRIKVVRVPEKGVSNARNAALAMARGTYICFADSDDMLDSDFLKTLYAERDSDLVVCGYTLDSLDGNGEIFNSVAHNPVGLDWKVGEPKAKLQGQFELGYMHFCWNKLFKRSIINEHDLRFDTIPVNEDYLFVMDYLRHVKSVKIINNALYHWIRPYGRQTGVNSIPENLLEIYNRSQIATRQFFDDNTIADRIAYFTYELIIYKFYQAYKNRRMSKSELNNQLHSFHSNELIQSAYASYKPQSMGDRLLYTLAKNGRFRLHYFLTQKLLKIG